MSRRVKRVCALIKRELGPFIQKQGWFKNVLVTIADVDMTPDLKQAHVYFGVIGSDSEKSDIKVILTKNRIMLQNHIGRRVVMKFTPRLYFHIDDSVERGVEILRIMDSIDIPDDDSEPTDA